MSVISSVSQFYGTLKMNGLHTFKKMDCSLHGNKSKPEKRPDLAWCYPCFWTLCPVCVCVCVSICNRCVSCLSTRWKCYWDQENHLCVSSKDESKHNLIEVSTGHSPLFSFSKLFSQQTPRASPNIKSRLFVAPDIIQTLSVQHLQVCCNDLPADGSGKSSRVVILCEVLVSPLQCGGMWSAAVKSQVVPISHTPCRAIYYCKVLQASTKVYVCGSISQISQHV